jgi:hypothetical protein
MSTYSKRKDKVGIEIADIEFAYDNHELINLLKKRGTAITNLKFDQIKAADWELEQLVKDQSKWDKLIRPVCAFITFQTDDAKNEALSYSKPGSWFQKQNEVDLVQETIFNVVPKFKQATEPTNIIWENRYIKGVNLWARLFGALLISIFMLTIVFWVIFFFKQA